MNPLLVLLTCALTGCAYDLLGAAGVPTDGGSACPAQVDSAICQALDHACGSFEYADPCSGATHTVRCDDHPCTGRCQSVGSGSGGTHFCAEDPAIWTARSLADYRAVQAHQRALVTSGTEVRTAFIDGNDLFYARRPADGDWVVTEVGLGLGAGATLTHEVYAQKGEIEHVLFTSGGRAVFDSSFVGGSWLALPVIEDSTRQVVGARFLADQATQPNRYVALHLRGDDDVLAYGHAGGDYAWVKRTLPVSDDPLELAVDADGRPFIVFRGDDLTLAAITGPDADLTMTLEDLHDPDARFAQLAIAPVSRTIYVAAPRESGGGKLYERRPPATTWTVGDLPEDVHTDADLTVDATGHVQLVYGGRAGRPVTWARRRANGQWDRFTVTTGELKGASIVTIGDRVRIVGVQGGVLVEFTTGEPAP